MWGMGRREQSLKNMKSPYVSSLATRRDWRDWSLRDANFFQILCNLRSLPATDVENEEDVQNWLFQ